VGGRNRGTARLALAGTVLAVAVLLTALPRPAASQEAESPSVAVATTGQRSEIINTIPVSRSPGAEPRVVMSLAPGQLPSLTDGDRLRVSAEVQITADCTFKRPRCAGRPYRYSPVLRGRLILADGMQVTGGGGAVTLGQPDANVCRQVIGDREHHCMLVPRGGLDVGGGGALPCDPSSCHLNFVVDAYDPRADPGDVVVVGGQRPNGDVLHDKGRINAVRLRGETDPLTTSLTANGRVHEALPLNLSKQVVYSQRLDGLRDHEQLEVEATMITDISHLPYAARIGARVILAKGKRATGQGHVVKEIADLNGEIAENNGFNCTQAESPCLTRKVGVLRMKKDANGPLYINLVAITGPKNTQARPGDRVRVGKAGGLGVIRFAPELQG
jgi:hypothetical protein